MAGLSSATSASATSATVPGTNVPPVSFPGIASGIDYDSIITKLTNLTLLPVTQYKAEITQINAKNSELIKINGLLTSVQTSLTTLSNPSTFNSFTGTTSDSSVLTATSNTSGGATPGSYVISNTQLATASSVTGSNSVGHALSDIITSDSINPANDGKPSDTVPLDESFAAITPTNGGNQRGQVTIDGQIITYDVASDSIQTIVANINAAVVSVDPGFTASYNAATDAVTFSSTDQSVSLGSPTDRGNLLTVLKLDVAQVNNTPTSGSVTSAGPIGGLNQATVFTAANNAGLKTPLTGGDGSFFTINGVKITINPSQDNIAGVLSKINSSAAGVTATFDPVLNEVRLTSKSTGPQGIVIGASGDTSNFLASVGLTPATGATSTVGNQAELTLVNPNGTSSQFFSNSNTISAAIPGINLNIFQTSTALQTVTVTQDASVAINAINAFASAYNAAINEINQATAAPVVQQTNSATSGSGTTSTSSTVAPGGTLYGDFSIEELKDQLINLGQNIVHNGNSSFQSLSSIGLQMDDSHEVLQASDPTASTTSSGPVTVATQDGTSGAFTALNLDTFNAAFAANPQAVSSIFNASDGIVSGFGNYLTTITGLPTTTSTGLLGSIPTTSFIQNDENANTARIQSLNDFITTLQDEANLQADSLRAQFTASESLIAKYQAVQTQVSQLSQGLG
jgi:flagellar hook-associated protein 2